ncbi:MAG: hypothetical protein HQK54_05225 [Oligoflexales bacterium]|nr:hypothetical protein [Oligoflexales bacterium]
MRIFKLILILTAIAGVFAGLLEYNFTSLINNNRDFVELALSKNLNAKKIRFQKIEAKFRLKGVVVKINKFESEMENLPIEKIHIEDLEIKLNMLRSILSMDLKISSMDIAGLEIKGRAPGELEDKIKKMLSNGESTDKGGGLSGHLSFMSSLKHLSISDAVMIMEDENGNSLPPQKLKFNLDKVFSGYKISGVISGLNRKQEETFLRVSGTIDISESGVDTCLLDVETKNPGIRLNSIFPEELSPKHLSMKFEYGKYGKKSHFKLVNVEYEDRYLQMTGQTDITIDMAGLENKIDITLNVQKAEAGKISNYIPSGVISQNITNWLKQSIKSGSIEDGIIRIKTTPEKSREDSDEKNPVHIAFTLKNGSLKFAPEWPEVSGINATMTITDRFLEAKISSGRSCGVWVGKSRVTIPSFNNQSRRIKLALVLSTDDRSALCYLGKSPLSVNASSVLSKFEIEQTKIGLDLTIPLTSDFDEVFAGSVLLENARIRHRQKNIELTEIGGSIDFTRKWFETKGLTAKLMNIPISLDVRKSFFDGDGSVDIKMEGTFGSALLSKAGDSSWTSFLSGETPYRAEITVKGSASGENIRFLVHSDLKGIRVRIPHIYEKEQDDVNHFEIKGDIDGSEKTRIEASIQKNWKFLYESPGMEQTGFSGYLVNGSPDNIPGTSPGRFIIETPEIKGYVTSQNKGRARLLMKFSKMDLMTQVSKTVILDEGTSSGRKNSAFSKFVSFQPVDLSIDHLHCNDIEIRNLRGTISGNETTIKAEPLSFLMDGSTIEIGEAAWSSDEKNQMTRIRGRVSTKDLGILLKKRADIYEIEGLSGNIDFSASWPETPWKFDKKILAGSVDADLKKGTLKEANSIINRIVNIITLNLQQTFKKDLEIRKVKGTLKMEKGILSTDSFVIDLSGAETESKGTLDPFAETLDVKVKMAIDITRLIKTGILFAINPVLGGIYWLEGSPDEGILNLNSITRHGYEITGSWKDPKIKIQPPKL